MFSFHLNSYFGLFCFSLLSVSSFGLISDTPSLTQWNGVQLHKYHSHEELTAIFKTLERNFPAIAKTGIIGKSVQGRDLIYLHITANVSSPRPVGKPMVKYVGNMHGNEAVGREMLIALAEYLVQNFEKDAKVTTIVQSTDIFILPSINPDGFAKAKVNQRPSRVFFYLKQLFCLFLNHVLI